MDFEVYSPTHRSDEPSFITVPVVRRKREHGGWLLVHAETGRELGWMCRSQNSNLWEVRVCPGAFRGDADSEGNVLDTVPSHLYSGDPSNPSFRCFPIQSVRTLDKAAEILLSHLVYRRAPGIGFGPHPEVRTWESRRTVKA